MTIPRTLTVDDNVPVGSIIIDNNGDAYQLRSPKRWHAAAAWEEKPFSLKFLIEYYGPITLVWKPSITTEKEEQS